MRKTFFLMFVGTILKSGASACDSCSITQPAILRGISHGPGPDSQWDYWIVAAAAVSVVFTLFFSVKWLISPGEKSKDHIKNLALIFE